MLERLVGQPPEKKPELRDALFGDLSLSQWCPKSSDPTEPWTSFARVKQCLDRGDQQGAVLALRSIVATPDLESRHYLEAWSFLRDLGVSPPKGKAKDVLGVVVEVGMDRGLDLVAAYLDHHARYYNFSGAGVVWERPNNSLDKPIDDILSAAAAAVKQVEPWDNERPPAPPVDQVRINILTPSGLHFGQGPYSALAKDRIGGPVLRLAFELMQQLIKLPKKS